MIRPRRLLVARHEPLDLFNHGAGDVTGIEASREDGVVYVQHLAEGGLYVVNILIVDRVLGGAEGQDGVGEGAVQAVCRHVAAMARGITSNQRNVLALEYGAWLRAALRAMSFLRSFLERDSATSCICIHMMCSVDSVQSQKGDDLVRKLQSAKCRLTLVV